MHVYLNKVESFNMNQREYIYLGKLRKILIVMKFIYETSEGPPLFLSYSVFELNIICLENTFAV
jgi:hypothetical protein